MRLYVASSWRNELQPGVVERLRQAGHEVYDFRNPAPGEAGFAWSDIDPRWQSWDRLSYVQALGHEVARHGYARDWAGMQWADAFVLVQPCGRSAHLEAGWAVGAGKPVIVLLAEGQEPELMLKLVQEVPGGGFAFGLEELVESLERVETVLNPPAPPRDRARRGRVELDDDADAGDVDEAIDEVEEDRSAEDLRQILSRLVNRLPEGEDLIDVLCRDNDDRETAGQLLDKVIEAL